MNTIADAIHNRQVISFDYHGKHRVVEPHTYGIDQMGHKALVAYQVGGTASERIPCWRTFHESEMRALCVLEQKFAGHRPNYRRNDPAFATIFAQL